MSEVKTPAGWYPAENGQERYWDGGAWTDQRRPSPVLSGLGQGTHVPKSRSTTKVVLIVLGVLLVLFLGGCLAVVGVVGGAVNEVVEKETAEDAEPGGPDNPLDINVGEAFEVRGFEYEAGWSIRKDFVGDIDVRGLKVTNNRDEKDSALVTLKFWSATEVLAEADCTTSPISPGTTVSMSCFSADKLPKDYDRLTIQDAF